MRKLLVTVLVILLAVAFAWSQNMENAGIDYTTALTKKAARNGSRLWKPI